MMTRRAVLRLVAGMPFAGAKLAASKEFWEAEDPEQWSKDEVGHLLNQSPWAKPAAISFRNSGGVLNPNGPLHGKDLADRICIGSSTGVLAQGQIRTNAKGQ